MVAQEFHRRNRVTSPASKVRGFTLIELLIVIGVIVVLIALLLPSVASVRARARTAQAQSNLTQLGLAIKAANRNRSTPVKAVSGSRDWMKQIKPFLEGEDKQALFVSPADPKAEQRKEDGIPSFAANNRMHRMGSGDGNKIVMLDFEEEEDQDGVFNAVPKNSAENDWILNGEPAWQNALEAAGQRQGGNVNVLRDDGSVSSEPAQDLMDYHPQNSPEDWVPWRTPEEDRWKCPTGDCEAPDELVDDLAPSVPEDTSEEQSGEDSVAEPPPAEEESGCAPGTEVVVAEPALVGNWSHISDHKALGSHNAEMHRTNKKGQGHKATFAAQITEPGEYRVYLWWKKNWALSNQVDVTIRHADGEDQRSINQAADTGETWQFELGTYNFDDAGSVVLVNSGSNPSYMNYAIADAVRFECTSAGETSPGLDPCYPPTDPTGAVDRALEWISAQQRDDGSFNFADSGGGSSAMCAATGLALLAYLGNGNTPWSGTYKQNVCDAVKFLIAGQDKAGSTPTAGSGSCRPWPIPPGSFSMGGALYGHLIAHWAMAEALILSEEAHAGDCAEGCPELTMAQIEASTRAATAYTTAAIACDGGWAYQPYWGHTGGSNSHVGDTSHHHFAMAALVASHKGGIEDPQLDYCLKMNKMHLDRVGDDAITDTAVGYSVPTTYGYRTSNRNANMGAPRLRRLTACGLVSRSYVYLIKTDFQSYGGIPASSDVIKQFFENNEPEISEACDMYYNKPATLLAYQAGGEVWSNWIGKLEPHLLATQNGDGSWDFGGNTPGGVGTNSHGGPLYCTVMAVLCLEPGYAGLKLFD